MTSEKGFFTKEEIIAEAKKKYSGQLGADRDTWNEAHFAETLEEAVDIIVTESMLWNGDI